MGKFFGSWDDLKSNRKSTRDLLEMFQAEHETTSNDVRSSSFHSFNLVISWTQLTEFLYSNTPVPSASNSSRWRT